MKVSHQSDYRLKRKNEYPDVGDQLDALWSIVTALSKGNLPEDVQDVANAIAAVKLKYPKPKV